MTPPHSTQLRHRKLSVSSRMLLIPFPVVGFVVVVVGRRKLISRLRDAAVLIFAMVTLTPVPVGYPAQLMGANSLCWIPEGFDSQIPALRVEPTWLPGW